MPGYIDHNDAVRKVAEEQGFSPDSVDTAIRAVFGYHGMQDRVANHFRKANIPMLGEFRVVFLHKYNLVRKRARAKKAKNRRAFKKWYNKHRKKK